MTNLQNVNLRSLYLNKSLFVIINRNLLEYFLNRKNFNPYKRTVRIFNSMIQRDLEIIILQNQFRFISLYCVSYYYNNNNIYLSVSNLLFFYI